MSLESDDPITEVRHAWGFMVWDPSDGMATREEITIASGAGVLTAGMVLGRLDEGGTAAYAAQAGNTGNFTCGNVTVGTEAQPGVYAGVMGNATAFDLAGPDGAPVGKGVFGTAFDEGGLGFTVTAGGTAAVVDDAFSITVTESAAETQYAPYDPTATSGLQTARAVLGSERKDATSGNVTAGALVRGPARVNSSELVYGGNVTTTTHVTNALASLAAAGIQSTPGTLADPT